GLRDAHRKRNEPEPTPDALVCPLDDGLMVSYQDQLVRRMEIERLAVGDAAGELVPAGEVLHERLVQSPPLRYLARYASSHAMKLGDVIFVGGIVALRQQRFDRQAAEVVSEQHLDYRDEGRFS